MNIKDVNWNKKEEEIRQEIKKFNGANYKTRIQIIKTFILSKLLFLASVFPPDEKCIMRINKLCKIHLGLKPRSHEKKHTF